MESAGKPEVPMHWFAKCKRIPGAWTTNKRGVPTKAQTFDKCCAAWPYLFDKKRGMRFMRLDLYWDKFTALMDDLGWAAFAGGFPVWGSVFEHKRALNSCGILDESSMEFGSLEEVLPDAESCPRLSTDLQPREMHVRLHTCAFACA